MVYFNCKVKQSDLCIGAEYNLKKQAEESIKKYRQQVEEYIRKQPVFLHSLEPVKPLPGAPEIINHMCRASAACGVGPMAAIAGAVSFMLQWILFVIPTNWWLKTGGIYILSEKENGLWVSTPASRL